MEGRASRSSGSEVAGRGRPALHQLTPAALTRKEIILEGEEYSYDASS